MQGSIVSLLVRCWISAFLIQRQCNYPSTLRYSSTMTRYHQLITPSTGTMTSRFLVFCPITPCIHLVRKQEGFLLVTRARERANVNAIHATSRYESIPISDEQSVLGVMVPSEIGFSPILASEKTSLLYSLKHNGLCKISWKKGPWQQRRLLKVNKK